MEAGPWRRKGSSSTDLDTAVQRPLKPLLQLPPVPAPHHAAEKLPIAPLATSAAGYSTPKGSGFARPHRAGSENWEDQMRLPAPPQSSEGGPDSSKKLQGAHSSTSRWSRFSVKAGLAASRSATLASSQLPADKPCCLASSSQDRSTGQPAAGKGISTVPRSEPPQAALPEMSRHPEDLLHHGHGSVEKGSQQHAREPEPASNGRAELQSSGSGSARTHSDPKGCRESGHALAKTAERLLPVEKLMEKVPWAKPATAAPSCEDGDFDLLDGGLDFDPAGASSPAIVSMLALQPRGAAAAGEVEKPAPRREWRLPFAAPRAAPKADKSASSAGNTVGKAAEPAAMRPPHAAANAPSIAEDTSRRDDLIGAGGASMEEQSPIAEQRLPPLSCLPGVVLSSKSLATSTAGATGRQYDAGHRCTVPEARVAPADLYYDYADRDEYPDEDLADSYGQDEAQHKDCEPASVRPAAEDRRISNEEDLATAACKQPASKQQQRGYQEAEPHQRSCLQQQEMVAPLSTGGRSVAAERGCNEGLDHGDRLAGPSRRAGNSLQDIDHESRIPGGVSWTPSTGDVAWDTAHTHSNLEPAAQAPKSSLPANRSRQRKPKRRLLKLYSEEDDEETCKTNAGDEQCEDEESTGLEEAAQQPAKTLKRLKRGEKAAPMLGALSEADAGTITSKGGPTAGRKLPASFLADSVPEHASTNPFVSSKHLQQKQARAAVLPRVTAEPIDTEPLDLSSAVTDIDAQLKRSRSKRKAALEPELIDLTDAEPPRPSVPLYYCDLRQKLSRNAPQPMDALDEEDEGDHRRRGRSPLEQWEDDWEDDAALSKHSSPYRAATVAYRPRHANTWGDGNHTRPSRSAWDMGDRPQGRQLGSSGLTQGDNRQGSSGSAPSGRPWWYRFPDFVPLAALADGRNPRTGAVVYIDYASQFQDTADAADAPGPSKRGRGAAKKSRSAAPRKKDYRAPAKGRRSGWRGRRK